jgi:hypothetical protein
MILPFELAIFGDIGDLAIFGDLWRSSGHCLLSKVNMKIANAQVAILVFPSNSTKIVEGCQMPTVYRARAQRDN